MKKYRKPASVRWLREKAAIEDTSLMSVGGLVSKLGMKPKPKVKTAKTSKPTDEQISKKYEEATVAVEIAYNAPGIIYAQGVRDALKWVLGDAEDLYC